jgi:hypothetical protein
LKEYHDTVKLSLKEEERLWIDEKEREYLVRKETKAKKKA